MIRPDQYLGTDIIEAIEKVEGLPQAKNITAWRMIYRQACECWMTGFYALAMDAKGTCFPGGPLACTCDLCTPKYRRIGRPRLG